MIGVADPWREVPHDRRPSDGERVSFAAAARAMTPPVTSQSERECVRLRALGLTIEEVAERLSISVYAVKTLTARAYRKLDAACLVDACRAYGWLRVPAA